MRILFRRIWHLAPTQSEGDFDSDRQSASLPEKREGAGVARPTL